jgi:ATP-dependent DNA helicase RecQ
VFQRALNRYGSFVGPESINLLPLLKKHFGYDSFRPWQEAIVRDALAGRDVFAVLPTGGGKSLCFQLPALVRPGLTVVVSPLIALMKDQVDALLAAGIPATFLNSSLEAGASRVRYRGLYKGEYRLLYVSPERLLLSGFIEDLEKWNMNLLAVDEAHCVSDWGHDFRPEYRQIATLRTRYPDVPLMALTATATDRVRADITTQLDLRDPACYVASFNRPNLTYRVEAKAQAYERTLSFLRAHPQEGGIIYCQARKTADTLAARLVADGIAAAPYHAGMAPKDREKNQDAFLRDELQVICATIAFGMGINKPNVRFVIHHDLPKNMESYYQETGRAGRDGLPSECLLLYSPGDRMKYLRFIDEKPDPEERQVARQQLERMIHYAECESCRRVDLLGYFGENYTGETDSNDSEDTFDSVDSDQVNIPRSGSNASSITQPLPASKVRCGSCDNCLSPRETWDGTVAAQKFLSCVYRIQQKSRFLVGIQHVVAVLCGAVTEKIQRFGHDTLSTYGIGKELDRKRWSFIGRELVRLGFIRQDPDRFNGVELTETGLAVLKSRQPITLTQPVIASEAAPARVAAGDIPCDESLFQRLRSLRKRLADEKGVPPYVVFSDVALRQMARYYPETPDAFTRISGVGEVKLRDFGDEFLRAIDQHLTSNPRQTFQDPTANTFSQQGHRPAKPAIGDTVEVTLQLWNRGGDVESIATTRGLKASTIYGHLNDALRAGKPLDVSSLFNPTSLAEIGAAFEQNPSLSLTELRAHLNDRYPYGMLLLYRTLHSGS